MWLWMKSWENGNKNLRQPDAPLALSGVGGLYIWLPHFFVFIASRWEGFPYRTQSQNSSFKTKEPFRGSVCHAKARTAGENKIFLYIAPTLLLLEPVHSNKCFPLHFWMYAQGRKTPLNAAKSVKDILRTLFFTLPLWPTQSDPQAGTPKDHKLFQGSPKTHLAYFWTFGAWTGSTILLCGFC